MNQEAVKFQEALAVLIRFPRRNRGVDFPPFVEKYQLSENYVELLRGLSEDRNLFKYGRNMSNVRWGMVHRSFPLSQRFLSDEVLDAIWEKHFEMKAIRIRGVDIADYYFRFVQSDSEARSLIESTAAPFVFDLLKFEHSVLRFRQGRFAYEHKRKGPDLAHVDFDVLELEYDILPLIMQRKKVLADTSSVSAPIRRPHKLLLLRGAPFPRTFEIDEKTAAFLLAQLRGEEADRPDGYGDLIQLGVCTPN